MRNLNFKYISAKNFLCFGPEGVEIKFDDYSNIILVRGNNLDVKDQDKVSSNGVGKSSIPEIIVYTLFGKTIKNPKKVTHKDVINNQISKGLKTEVIWGDYRVVRTRKPDSLRLWENKEHVWNDDSEITLGGMPATQKLLEEKIGLNYETFVNLMVFTDNNAGSFLECDASNKREIIENLLSLDKYRNFADKAKELKKEKKDLIKSVSYEYDTLLSNLNNSKNRLKITEKEQSDWLNNKENEIIKIKEKIEDLKKDLRKTDSGNQLNEYLEAQKKINDLSDEASELEVEYQKIDSYVSKAKSKLDEYNRNKNKININLDNVKNSINKNIDFISKIEKQICELESKNGSKCKYCHGKISPENYGNYVNELNKEMIKLKEKISEEEKEVDKFKEEIGIAESKISEIESVLVFSKNKLNKISEQTNNNRKTISVLSKINKPQNEDFNIKLIEEKITSLQEQLIHKEQEKPPFSNILDSIKKELDNNLKLIEEKKIELDELESILPYYDFWVSGFGDSGIRKFIIDGIIPPLNSRIAYWMEFLIDGKIKLLFNNELEETIERNPSDGDPFVYHAMSGGERRRLNLAVSQAFAYIMMLNSGIFPSIVFLDEVTTNIDSIGVYGVYNMIVELAKDRKVFVTTHDQNLLDLLEGCQMISLEKRDGFTKLINS